MNDLPHTPAKIGERLRHVRTVLGLSQTEMAEICGTAKATVSNWEHGRQRPTIAQMEPFTERYGLTLDFIYLGRAGGLSLDVARRLGLA